MMDPRSVDAENLHAQAQRLDRYRKVRDAFVEMFGPEGKRTPQGAIILDELEKFCGTRKLINELDNDGATDVPRTFRKHGRCDVIQAIHDLINWREPENKP